LVYVGSTDDCVYALNAATGVLVWSYRTGSDVYSSPAVSNGVVYIGSYDHNVYAFGSTASQSSTPVTTYYVTAAAVIIIIVIIAAAVVLRKRRKHPSTRTTSAKSEASDTSPINFWNSHTRSYFWSAKTNRQVH
jgi:hypothetical protein